ncbi:hypothetical protein Pla22_32550 [Rubripirellula amarantea]|uniref:Uncharacterized protein n=1 Tax=Rubripirellula amarantea TaxID=2527999 RepID=A0A5C5WL68_9BACT|nr:prepilin-type N-terminal cleavage/methylation domain-containing protein [Rubripirellula amarantea]TWT50512.1 hypothetical protein Pla22_32550 [Rubripirellula amarantea]
MLTLTHRIAVRTALTLVELLVALAVISVLAGIALPTVKNTLKDQKVSRAATTFQAVIEEARARSIEGGGGGGVIIDRIGTDNVAERSEAIRFRFAAATPDYRGDYSNEVRYRNLVDGATAGPLTNPDGPRGTTGQPNDLGVYNDYHYLLFDPFQGQMQRSAIDIAGGSEPTLVNIGDIIHIGDAGFPMRIRGIIGLSGTHTYTNQDWGTVLPADLTGYTLVEVEPMEANTNLRRLSRNVLTFSIERAPRPAIAMPIEMPKGTSVDLTSSGLGRYGNEFSPMFIAGNYLDTTLTPFQIPAATPPNLVDRVGNYRSIVITFGARGEVSRVFATTGIDGTSLPLVGEIAVTGDIHFLVSESGEVKTDPEDQLEDNDPDPLADQEKDGKTPLLNTESIWVTIKARTGEVYSSSWIDPTDSNTRLIPPQVTTPTDATQQDRIRSVIGLTRSNATETRRLQQ